MLLLYKFENGGGSTKAPRPLIQNKNPVALERWKMLLRADTPKTGGSY